MFYIIRELVSNPLYVGLLFFILTYIGYLFFVKKYQLSKVQWKKADYVWLALTALSLFSILDKNRIMLNEIDYRNARFQAIGTSRSIKDHLSVQWICLQGTRDINSPENFEEIQTQGESSCKWVKAVLSQVTTKLDSLVAIEISSLSMIHVTNEYYSEHIEAVKRLIELYNLEIEETNQMRLSTSDNEAVKLLEFFSPILLCIGFAIRIVKTMGEIKIERNSINSKLGSN